MSLYLGETPIAVNSSSREIGEIIQSTIPLSDAGLHLLDGSLISGSGSYGAFVTYIAGLVSNYPDLFITETAWQQAVTDYGVCGKFVYDSVNNTVRLPKITGFTEGTISPITLGDLVEAGLPNITGSWAGVYNSQGLSGAVSGTFKNDGSYPKPAFVNDSATESALFDFDASRSSPIYGNSSTVQPQSIKVLYYIVIATTTKTEIEVDIDEIATDLNGKADVDLSNVNSSGTSLASGWAMPSSRYIDLTLGASGTSYTAPANGWVQLSLEIPASTWINIQTQTPFDGNVVQFSSQTYSQTWATVVPVVKNAIFSINYNNFPNTSVVWTRFRFIYAEGEN